MGVMKVSLKKLILAVLGLAFALAFTSCDEQGKKCENQKGQDKEKHHRRW
jgi:hypothetical protein